METAVLVAQRDLLWMPKVACIQCLCAVASRTVLVLWESQAVMLSRENSHAASRVCSQMVDTSRLANDWRYGRVKLEAYVLPHTTKSMPDVQAGCLSLTLPFELCCDASCAGRPWRLAGPLCCSVVESHANQFGPYRVVG